MLYFTTATLCPKTAPQFEYGYDKRYVHEYKPHTEETDTFLSNIRTPLFEHLRGTEMKKMYFDIDFQCEGQEEYEADGMAIITEAVDLLLDTLPTIKRDQLYITSYSGQDKSVHKQNNKKYGKWLLSYHIVVDGYTITNTDNKAIATHLHSINDFFDTSVYSNNQLFRVGFAHKFAKREAGCRSPQFVVWDIAQQAWKLLTNASKDVDRTELRYKNLINHTTPDMAVFELPEGISIASVPTAPKPTDTPTPTPPPTTAPAPNQQEVDSTLFDILQRLPNTDNDEYKSWLFITTLCKALDAKATWEAWCKNSSKYDATKNDHVWNSITSHSTFPNALAILKKRANKTSVSPIIWALHEAYEECTDRSHAKFFVEHFGKNFRVVNDKLTYYFNPINQLWVPSTDKCIFSFFMEDEYQNLWKEYQAEFVAKPKMYFPPMPSDFKDQDESKWYEQCIKRRIGSFKLNQQTKTVNHWKTMIMASNSLRDKNFCCKLNADPTKLSVRNGLVDLTDGTLRPRIQEDYVSQCLDIEYNPDVKPEDNPAFTKFVHDIFDHPDLDTEAVVQWIQLWLGYCITGYNNAECCLIWFGNGANGKGIMQELLINILRCTDGNMIDTWNASIIQESNNTSGNAPTPELAKLEGVRCGVINELPEGLHLGEQYKKLIDANSGMNVRGLYEASKRIKLMCSFNLLTNSLPTFPPQDAYWRRMKLAPMLLTFCANPDPKKPNQRLWDTGLKTKLFASEKGRQAILAWFMQGAKRYIANPKALEDQPECCSKYLKEYIADTNYMRLFEYSDNPKDVLAMVDIMQYIGEEFEHVPKRPELNAKFKELTGNNPAKVMAESGKRSNGYRNVKLVQKLEDATEQPTQEYGFS